MLNSDMALIKDLEITNEDLGTVSCSFDECADLPGIADADTTSSRYWVDTFAESNTRFVMEFINVFERLINRGVPVNN